MSESKQAAAPTAQEQKQLFVHLTGCGRYFVDGVLYKSGVAYPVPDREVMYKYLDHRCEGKQMFSQYIPKPKRVVQVETGDTTPVEALPTPEVEKVAPPKLTGAEQKDGKIVVGSPDEKGDDIPEATGESIEEV